MQIACMDVHYFQYLMLQVTMRNVLYVHLRTPSFSPVQMIQNCYEKEFIEFEFTGKLNWNDMEEGLLIMRFTIVLVRYFVIPRNGIRTCLVICQTQSMNCTKMGDL